MSNKDSPAFPVGGDWTSHSGLTKREVFTLGALIGLCADPKFVGREISKAAISVADNTLKLLEDNEDA